MLPVCNFFLSGMTQNGPVQRHRKHVLPYHFHQFKTPWEPVGGKHFPVCRGRPQIPGKLPGRQIACRPVIPPDSPERFHLRKNQHAAIPGNNIQFAVTAPPVAGKDLITAPPEKFADKRFPAAPQPEVCFTPRG